MMRALWVGGWIVLGAVACGDDAQRMGLDPLDAAVGLDLGVGRDGGVSRCATVEDCAPNAQAGSCLRPVCLDDGTCGSAPVPDDSPCEDGDACTEGDRCLAGACIPGTPRDSGPCEDGDPCTRGGTCTAGVCGGGAPVVCDDGDHCTHDSCEPGVGCVFAPVVCPDPPGEPCEQGVCEPATGACAVGPRPEGAACDDGLACTVGATCRAGACVGFVAPMCDDDNACTVDSCTPDGCANEPVTGSCDDGDPCTTGDVCEGGVCVGAPIVCSDDDPCTTDACVGGQCRFDPIPGCVPLTGDCSGKQIGAACNDGDAATVADLCAGGVCRGFVAVRVSAPVSEGWRFTRVDHGRGAWTVAVALDDASDGAIAALATVTTAGHVELHGATRGESRFTGLHGGFAATTAGALWVRGGSGWDGATSLDDALGASGRGTVGGIWAHEDAAGVRLWLVGTVGTIPWARRCTTIGLAVLGLEAQCTSQSLPVADAPTLRAVTGALSCTLAGCQGGLALAADMLSSVGADGVPQYFNDVYVSSGANALWQVAAFDPGPSPMVSNDLVALSQGTYLVVGGSGYLRHNAASGTWTSPTATFADQASLHFEGAWAGEGALVLAGWRTVGGPTRRLELFVAPQGGDPSDPGAWTRHTLGTESAGSAGAAADVGLVDVWGHGGVWIAAGTGRPAGGGPAQGLLFIRAP